MRWGEILMKKSICEFLTALVGSAYSIYIISYFGKDFLKFSNFIAAAMVTPHILCCTIGTIFAWIAFFSNKFSFAITAVILYSAAAVLFIMYAPFMIPEILFGLIGCYRIRKNQNMGV